MTKSLKHLRLRFRSHLCLKHSRYLVSMTQRIVGLAVIQLLEECQALSLGMDQLHLSKTVHLA